MKYIGIVASILGVIIALTTIIGKWPELSTQQLRVVSLIAYALVSGGMLWVAFDKSQDIPQGWRWAALGTLYLVTIPFFIWVGSWIETQDNKQTVLAVEIYKTYEWQWAGENWYGRLTFDERKGRNVVTEAKVGLIEKECATDQIWIDGKILELVDESTFQ